MRRIEWLILGLVVSASIAAAPPIYDGPAYRTLGRMAVQQQGRRKPFDTLAREALKQIHGDSSVAEIGLAGEVVATWSAVAAVFDWSVRPEHWDDRDFILVSSIPLKQLLLNQAVRGRLETVAAHPTTPRGSSDTLKQLATSRDISRHDLEDAAELPGLVDEDRASLVRLARKLSAGHKWLSPNDLEDAVFALDGKERSFHDSFQAILEKDRAIRTAQMSGRPRDSAPIAPLSVIEAKVMEVGERLIRYKALRDKNGRGMEGLEIEAAPRPVNSAYLAFMKDALFKAPTFVFETFPVQNLDRDSKDRLRDSGSGRMTDAFEANALEVLEIHIDEVKKGERYLPGTNREADGRYLSWLEEKAAWVPIRFLLDCELQDLVRAGYRASDVEAFRSSYRELEESERSNPGRASQERAESLVLAARKLGTSANKTYPAESALALETHYNRAAPFSWAPWPYGIALVLFLVCIGMSDDRGLSAGGQFGRALRVVGMVTLLAGIAIECYGFTLRVMISGWAPVTNMYETVIWVALIASVLGLILEWIYRKTFAALAASGVSLLTTVLAAKVPEQLLDPRIKGLTPVLRSNYWLTIHVLTIVSSYAAFALAMGLGLVAIGFYLTATYRRSARFGELAMPLVPGLALLIPGAVGILLTHYQTGPDWLVGTAVYYGMSSLVGLGGILTIVATLAMVGEAANRGPMKSLSVGLAGIGIGSSGLFFSSTGSGAVLLFNVCAALAGFGALVSVLSIFAMTNLPPLLDQRSLAIQSTAVRIKPISTFLYRAMQVGVLLVAAGTILGGVWADYSWGRFWGWDPKEVWALITLLVYLVPLHGRFTGWVNVFGLVVSSVVCFGAVLMAWYGVNFVLGVGLHSYGFSEGGGQGVVLSTTLSVLAVVFAAAWRRGISQSLSNP